MYQLTGGAYDDAEGSPDPVERDDDHAGATALAAVVYADRAMAQIARDEAQGRLLGGGSVSCFADIISRAGADYLTVMALPTNDARLRAGVVALIDERLAARAVALEQLDRIMRASHAIGTVRASGDLAALADPRSLLHRNLHAAAFDLALALVRIAAPNHGTEALRHAEYVIGSYLGDPGSSTTVAERIRAAVTEPPF